MILLLYGADLYRSKEKLEEIIENYKKARKSLLNLKFFEDKELSFEEFCNNFFSFSMFSEKKLFIIKKPFLNQEFKDKFLKEIKRFINSENIIIFYETTEILATDKFLELLKKNGKVQEFKPLKGIFLKNWIKKEVEKHKSKIDLKAIDKLISFVGNDTWRIANEIKKLISFKKNQRVEVEDIEKIVKEEIDINIFEMIDAIGLKDKKKALKLLHQQIEKGENSLYLLSMINFQFRNLLTIKELVEKNMPYFFILKKTQLNPFVFKKAYEQSQRFTLLELKRIYRKIFQVDFDIKTGKIEQEIALDLLIVKI